MPQLNKGGKFVFGLSVIHENRSVQIPPQAINEYRLSNENKIIIFTGSKITGGFCVTSYPLLSSSKLSHILKECPTLNDSSIFPGTLIPYKGRSYSWLPFNANLLSYLPALSKVRAPHPDTPNPNLIFQNSRF